MKFKTNIRVPDEINNVILGGMMKGKQKIEKQNKTIKASLKILASFVIAVSIFAFSVNVIPGFAASMKDIPILGTLVKAFQLNKSDVSGGVLNTESSQGEIFLKKENEKELLIINFATSENANLYSAKYKKNPQSITITLPGTRSVTALSDFKRANGESNFIKSVYNLITLDDSIVRYVVEIENSSDIQISEYKKPGQIVIEFKEDQGKGLSEVYSVRSFSYENNEKFAIMEENLIGLDYRILKDDAELRFFEFNQFYNEKDAQAFADKFEKMKLIVEKRFGNNVPVSFEEGKGQYEEYKFTLKYVEFLQNAKTPQDIMKFIDENKEQYPQYLEMMVKGLTGILRGMDKSQYNLDEVNKYYNLIGKNAEVF